MIGVTLRTILFGILLVLLIGDVATTTYALQIGRIEANPIATLFVWSPALHLLVKLCFAGVMLFLARKADQILPGAGTYCIAAAVVVYVFPVANNLTQIL